MTDYSYNPLTPEQRSLPPEGFVYTPGYVPASLDDWYPVDEVTGEPMPTADSGHRRLGGEYVRKYPKGTRGMRSPESMGSVVPVNWKPTLKNPVPPIRCVQIKEDGNRCNRWSLRGGTKCEVHSGPAAKAAALARVETARLRLVGMADDAIDVLQDLIRPGTNDAIRLKASTEILDRAGVKGAADINIEVEHKIDAGETLRARIEKIKQNKLKQLEDIHDAELEEDDEIIVEPEPETGGGDEND